MRILANYGCRLNGENFSVTMESYGDVERGQAGPVVDNLFELAKAAVQKQIDGKTTSVKTAATTQPRKSNGGTGKDSPATEKQISLISKFLYGIKPEYHSRMFQHVLGRKIDSCIELDKNEASRVVGSILNNRQDLMKAVTNIAA